MVSFLWLWFVFTLILNSLSEELAYRSFPIGNLRKSSDLSGLSVVLLTSVVFSLMHFLMEPPEILHFLYRLSFGLLAGVLYLQNRSLWSIVGLHTGWNFVSLTISDGHWKTGILVQLTGLRDHGELIANIVVLSTVSILLGLKNSHRLGHH